MRLHHPPSCACEANAAAPHRSSTAVQPNALETMADVHVPCRETTRPERVGAAREGSTSEKVAAPTSDVMSRADLAEGSRAMSLQDFPTVPMGAGRGGRTAAPTAGPLRHLDSAGRLVLSRRLVVALKFSHTLAKIFSHSRRRIWMVCRLVYCRTAPLGPHTASRHDIEMSEEIFKHRNFQIRRPEASECQRCRGESHISG